jgi:D-alanine-D-alanine ligase
VRVAVLGGGRSSEHDVSLASAASFARGLRDAGHEVVDVLLARDGTWEAEGEEVVVQPGRGLLGCDVAFPVLHGPFGEDGTVQGLLELLDVPYAGAGVLASAACLDKLVFKELMAAAGVPQVRHVGLDAERWAREPQAVRDEVAGLGFPCWVKPARLGSSVGIVRVAEPGEVDAAVAQALAHDPRVIVEASAPGLEVECSVLGRARSAEASQPGEIVPLKGSGWYDYEAKYAEGGMELVVPPRIAPAARERVRELAVRAFRHVGVEGLARADFFVDRDAVLLNELNTMPGFTETSVYGELWVRSGLPYPELVDRLAALAVERHREERAYAF